jgi:hypothetical protein
MKNIVLLANLVLSLMLCLPGCKKDGDTYLNNASVCTVAWDIATVDADGLVPNMTNKYILRCCEVIDHRDNPEDSSKDEGVCVTELLSILEKNIQWQAELAARVDAGPEEEQMSLLGEILNYIQDEEDQ